jgi:hypothetical protein
LASRADSLAANTSASNLMPIILAATALLEKQGWKFAGREGRIVVFVHDIEEPFGLDLFSTTGNYPNRLNDHEMVSFVRRSLTEIGVVV